jgi:hypothetical protein
MLPPANQNLPPLELTGMQKEKRTAGNTSAEHPEDLLNAAQLVVLEKMQGLGWELKFIRGTTPQDIVPVLFHPHINKTGILEADGSLNMQPDIRLRETDQSVLIACPKCGYMVYGRLWRCPGCGGSGF